MIQRILLSNPTLYRACLSMLAKKDTIGIYLNQYVRPKAHQRFLDVGCGPAQLLEQLPPLDYTGFDIDSNYIRQAKERFSDRGTFHVCDVNDAKALELSGFDIVNASGVLHHLNDDEALTLLTLAYNALEIGGRLVTLDGVFRAGQSPVARLLLKMDRGNFIRTSERYEALARSVFKNVEVHLREDLLSLPYSHLVLVCTRIA